MLRQDYVQSANMLRQDYVQSANHLRNVCVPRREVFIPF